MARRMLVRYIGVTLQDAQGSPSYEQALLANRRLVEGKWVTLIKERSDLNLQGQLVRYVLAQGVFVNHELVRQGFVRAASFPPDISCDEFLVDAQELAQAAELGIWGRLLLRRAPWCLRLHRFRPAVMCAWCLSTPRVKVGKTRMNLLRSAIYRTLRCNYPVGA